MSSIAIDKLNIKGGIVGVSPEYLKVSIARATNTISYDIINPSIHGDNIRYTTISDLIIKSVGTPLTPVLKKYRKINPAAFDVLYIIVIVNIGVSDTELRQYIKNLPTGGRAIDINAVRTQYDKLRMDDVTAEKTYQAESALDVITPYESEVVTLRFTTKYKGSAFGAFNLFRPSEDVPFGFVQSYSGSELKSFYKLHADTKIVIPRVDPILNGVLIYYRDISAQYKLGVWDVLNGTLELSEVTKPSDSQSEALIQLISRSFKSVVFLKSTGGDLDTKGHISIPGRVIKKYALLHLITTNPQFSDFYIDEIINTAFTKDRFFIFFSVGSGMMQTRMRLTFNVKEANGTEYTGKFAMTKGTHYIDIVVNDATSKTAISALETRLKALLNIYYAEEDNIQALYTNYLNDYTGVNAIEFKKAGRQKKKGVTKLDLLHKYAPEIFISKYSRVCSVARQPNVLIQAPDESDDDFRMRIVNLNAKLIGKNKHIYVYCNPGYRYTELQNKLENKHLFPLIPCCEVDRTIVSTKKSKKASGALAVTFRPLKESSRGKIYPNISEMLSSFGINTTDWIRQGVEQDSPNNFLAAIGTALGVSLDTFIPNTRKTMGEYLEENGDALVRQEMYDVPFQKILARAKQGDVKGRSFWRLLQHILNVNIIMLKHPRDQNEDVHIVLPGTCPGTVYYMAPFNYTAPTIFVLIMGDQTTESAEALIAPSTIPPNKSIIGLLKVIEASAAVYLGMSSQQLLIPPTELLATATYQILDTLGKRRGLVFNDFALLTPPTYPLPLPIIKRSSIPMNSTIHYIMGYVPVSGIIPHIGFLTPYGVVPIVGGDTSGDTSTITIPKVPIPSYYYFDLSSVAVVPGSQINNSRIANFLIQKVLYIASYARKFGFEYSKITDWIIVDPQHPGYTSEDFTENIITPKLLPDDVIREGVVGYTESGEELLVTKLSKSDPRRVYVRNIKGTNRLINTADIVTKHTYLILIVQNETIKNRLLAHLNIYLSTTPELVEKYHTQTFYINYYQTIHDFIQYKNTVIFTRKTDLDIYIASKAYTRLYEDTLETPDTRPVYVVLETGKLQVRV